MRGGEGGGRHRTSAAVAIEAPPEQVRTAARDDLGFKANEDGSLTGQLPGLPCGAWGVAHPTVTLEAAGDGTRASLDIPAGERVPYFSWVTTPVARLARKRAMRSFARQVEADLRDEPTPRQPRWFGVLPPVPVTPDQAARLAAVIMVSLLANAQGSLLTQFVAAAADTFGVGDRDIGTGLAVVRAGVLVSLVAAALADRIGRRRILLACLLGASLASLVTAVAPHFGMYIGSQLLVRSLTTAAMVVAAIGAVEEAPEGARAWSVAMVGLALGAGYGLSVILLPLADLGDAGWRVAFVVGAAGAALLPSLGRRLRETKRYQSVVAHHTRRGRLRQVFTDYEGPRFAILAVAVFAVNVFSAPSSQLTNRYLIDEHDYSHTSVAAYRILALALPAVIGMLLGGTLAERWGRRPVGILGVAVGTSMQMLFFVSSGTTLWLSSALSIVAVTAAGVALGALGAELFPTEVRGTSNGLLLVVGVLGSAVGLVVSTRLVDIVGSLGAGVAITGLAPLLAAFLVLPFLPETRSKRLDAVSPHEEGYDS